MIFHVPIRSSTSLASDSTNHHKYSLDTYLTIFIKIIGAIVLFIVYFQTIQLYEAPPLSLSAISTLLQL
jgi:low temperature requirement protein LtrA